MDTLLTEQTYRGRQEDIRVENPSVPPPLYTNTDECTRPTNNRCDERDVDKRLARAADDELDFE
jgi:hypothetical protein